MTNTEKIKNLINLLYIKSNFENFITNENIEIEEEIFII